jgi:hypothetical protein
MSVFHCEYNKRCVTLGSCLLDLAYKYLKGKEELWKLKYFMTQRHNLQKNPLKETKSLQGIITL